MCEFCELVESLKREDERRNNGLTHEYRSALISIPYYDGEYCGRTTYGSKPLNYCPVCGKKMEDES